jgi:hypothetical protein
MRKMALLATTSRAMTARTGSKAAIGTTPAVAKRARIGSRLRLGNDELDAASSDDTPRPGTGRSA